MFRRLLSPKLLFAIAAIFAFPAFIYSQDGPPPPRDQRPRNADRPNLLTQLGLSPEQVQQFRRLNAEHRPQMNEAQRRMREANRELDMVIYADTVSESLVNTKLKAFQDAQAEITRLRFGNELAIRKILTQEQLVRFREMRRRFAEMRDAEMRQGRNNNGDGSRPRSNQLKRAIRQDRAIN